MVKCLSNITCVACRCVENVYLILPVWLACAVKCLSSVACARLACAAECLSVW